MSEPSANLAPHSGACSFQIASRYTRTFALLAMTGAALACAPVKADEIAANNKTGTAEAAAPATTRAATCAGSIWWSELLAPETEKLTDFYAKVVGWNVKVVDAEDQSEQPSSPENRYSIFLNGDEEVAGLMKANHPVAAHSGLGWFTYIQVEDVDVTANKVVANGGTVLRHPVETETGDRIAVISDPMGNVFGIVTPADKDC